MSTIDTLISEASRAAEWRGHKLGQWLPGEYWRERRFAKCRVCGMDAAIDPAPPPNGIDISGEAVSMNCRNTLTVDGNQ